MFFLKQQTMNSKYLKKSFIYTGSQQFTAAEGGMLEMATVCLACLSLLSIHNPKQVSQAWSKIQVLCFVTFFTYLYFLCIFVYHFFQVFYNFFI